MYTERVKQKFARDVDDRGPVREGRERWYRRVHELGRARARVGCARGSDPEIINRRVK
jgi:hypothetical protein